MAIKRDIQGRKPAEDRKREIVSTALKLADKVGPDRLSAAMIARNVEISQPAVFKHFSSMNALWLAVAAHIETAMKKKWEAAFSAEKDEREQLRDLVLAQLRFIQTVPAVPGILFSRELHAGNKGLRQAFLKIMSALHNRITNIIASGQESGVFSRDVPAVDSAYLVLGFIQGLAVRWSVSGKIFPLVDEGERLFAIQMRLLMEEPSSGDKGDEHEQT